MFENDVKTYGPETLGRGEKMKTLFENDVKTYGTETLMKLSLRITRLRMM